jgi:hypothetical protein
MVVWGHPHYCTTSSSAPFSAPYPSSTLSHPLSLSRQQNGPFQVCILGYSSSRPCLPTLPTHQCQTRQTGRNRNKRRPDRTANHQSEGVHCQTHQEEAAIQHITKEDTTSDCPATMPHGPWHTSAQPSRQQQQQLSARQQHQP